MHSENSYFLTKPCCQVVQIHGLGCFRILGVPYETVCYVEGRFRFQTTNGNQQSPSKPPRNVNPRGSKLWLQDERSRVVSDIFKRYSALRTVISQLLDMPTLKIQDSKILDSQYSIEKKRSGQVLATKNAIKIPRPWSWNIPTPFRFQDTSAHL